LMSWRVAKSLNVLLSQVNAAWPDRSKVSDGSIGDANHQTRTSDHNPWVPPPSGGVVTARDFTHHPKAGADMHLLAEALRGSRDNRIKYVIWDRRMFSSYPTSSVAAWTWRPYNGRNPHTSHLHISVQPQAHLYDATARWAMPAVNVPPAPAPAPAPVVTEDVMSPSQEKKLDNVVDRLTDLDRRLVTLEKTLVDSHLRPIRRGLRALLAHFKLTVDGGP
jgi:hypothetical protein